MDFFFIGGLVLFLVFGVSVIVSLVLGLLCSRSRMMLCVDVFVCSVGRYVIGFFVCVLLFRLVCVLRF